MIQLKSFAKNLLIIGVVLACVLTALTWFCDSYFYRVDHAKVQLIAIEKTMIPQFAFKVSSLPLAVAARLKYGERSFKVVNAKFDRVFAAFEESSFIVIGTHGKPLGFVLDDNTYVRPQYLPLNPHLKFVYSGACYMGQGIASWSARYPSAKFIASTDLTTPLHGWVYLVFKSWYDLLRM